jgi:arylsulfatase A-like enzyme
MRLTVAVLALSAFGVQAQTAQAQSPDRPNVVLIITDDVGYGDIGSYGAPDVRTPNIDSLARDGTRLTDFYVAPSCTPTRAALITGRYQQRARLEVPLGSPGPAGDQGLRASGRSLPQLLKNNGYATALVGKWHLGYKPEMSPRAHGFDYFVGFKSGYLDYSQHTGGDGQHDLYENDEPTHVTGYMTDLITERSVKFIDQAAGRPFFLEVAYNAAHWPFQVPVQPFGERNIIMGQLGRFLKPFARASPWIRRMSPTTASSVAAMSWCILAGSSPSTKYGV